MCHTHICQRRPYIPITTSGVIPLQIKSTWISPPPSGSGSSACSTNSPSTRPRNAPCSNSLILATLGCVLVAALKYPDHAFLTRARQDLQACKVETSGAPLLGNLVRMIRNRNQQLQYLQQRFLMHGDFMYGWRKENTHTKCCQVTVFFRHW